MAEWSTAQVYEWVMQVELPAGCAETVSRIFADCEVEGDELAAMLLKPLLRMLAKGGMADPTLAAEAILKERDALTKRVADANECPLCFEVYSDDGDGQRLPRFLVACGHTVCHGCCALMLQPLQPSADRSNKPLACPVCRVETRVKGGKASSLPKNFSLLR